MARFRFRSTWSALFLGAVLLTAVTAETCAAFPVIQERATTVQGTATSAQATATSTHDLTAETATAAIQLPQHLLNISLTGLYAMYSDYTNFAGIAIPASDPRWPEAFSDGCLTTQYNSAPTSDPWVALALRSNCTFVQKTTAAALAGATGLIIVDNVPRDNVLLISGDNLSASTVPTVAVTWNDGQLLFNLTVEEPSLQVAVVVTSRPKKSYAGWTSVILNNAIFFFGAMMATVFAAFTALGARALYLRRVAKTAREDLARRVQERLDDMSTRPYDPEKDKTEEEDSSHDQCAICIQDYEEGDVVRELPCEHLFHQVCVDPWLLEHSSCPLCKRSVLAEEDAV
eukprot:m.69919 g.69919  ORF g.69919 m.69919 type:complete len:344 (-) comp13755_c2_seq1:76-1107(-)